MLMIELISFRVDTSVLKPSRLFKSVIPDSNCSPADPPVTIWLEHYYNYRENLPMRQLECIFIITYNGYIFKLFFFCTFTTITFLTFCCLLVWHSVVIYVLWPVTSPLFLKQVVRICLQWLSHFKKKKVYTSLAKIFTEALSCYITDAWSIVMRNYAHSHLDGRPEIRDSNCWWTPSNTTVVISVIFLHKVNNS